MTSSLQEAPWEMGSEFAWDPHLSSKVAHQYSNPATYRLFATATSAVVALGECISGSRARPVLHVPTYFCMQVIDRMGEHFEIIFYHDDPRRSEPDWESLDPSPGDFVLISNTFGIRDGTDWLQYYDRYPDVVFIEDHTHDPLSSWSRASTAHFCFQSVRKTIPLPDGAVLWSPRNLPLPETLQPRSRAARIKLSAMLMKQQYLAGKPVDKQIYRALEVQGEQALDQEPVSQASVITENFLRTFDIEDLRAQRLRNIETFLAAIEGQERQFRPLFTTWPKGAVPFNVILECSNGTIRDQLRSFLIRHNLYAAVHWDQTTASTTHDNLNAKDLAARVLTIPVDHRYSDVDIERAVEMLLRFTSSPCSQVQHSH